jgi:hypothetical protein
MQTQFIDYQSINWYVYNMTTTCTSVAMQNIYLVRNDAYLNSVGMFLGATLIQNLVITGSQTYWNQNSGNYYM